MSLLTMIQNAAEACSVEPPTAVVGSSDENAVRLLRWAQVEGRKLRARTLWPACRVEATFVSLAAELQGTFASIVTASYSFDYMVPETLWNRTQQRRIPPINAPDYQASKAAVAAGINPYFFIRGASLYLTPTPTAGDTYAFEFSDKSFCQAVAGTRKTAWSVDTDTGLLSEDLMELGVIWRWKKANGLDYAEDFQTYEEEVALAVGRVDPSETVSLSPRNPYGPLGSIIVPEGNWNVT